jgi:ATP-dependent DNA ligase
VLVMSSAGAALHSLRRARSVASKALSQNTLAPYRSGRSKTWLKTKCFTQSNFVVIGTDRDQKLALLEPFSLIRIAQA